MLFEKVKKTIEQNPLWEKGDRLVVGVSGGVDSMVLLHLLNTFREEYSLSLIIAHVNHGFRPEASEKEAAMVRGEAVRLGIPFEYGQFQTKEFQAQYGLSPQDAARQIRFHFFDEIFKKHHAQKIVLGHHADDQVETVLLRLIRGAGLQGLQGMLPVRDGKVIRPLLEVWREEIESFAVQHHIPFMHDASNMKKDYLRNRIRQDLIPFIEKDYQPNFKEIVLKTSMLLREENDCLEKETEEAYKNIIRKEKDILLFHISEYQFLHPSIRWRILRKLLGSMNDRGTADEEKRQLDLQQIYQKLQQSPPSFLIAFSFGGWAEKRYDMVFFGMGERNPVPHFEVEIVTPGKTPIPEIGKEILVEEADRNAFRDGELPSDTAMMDYERLMFPLTIRNFRTGDRFQPLGIRGTQKLKDYFIDHKIPRHERSRIPLLVSGGMIAWIAGHRIDERVKVTEKTKKVLKVKMV